MLKAGTPEKVGYDPIGTGPLSLAQYQKDSTILFTALPTTGREQTEALELAFSTIPGRLGTFGQSEKNECQVMPFKPGGPAAYEG